MENNSELSSPAAGGWWLVAGCAAADLVPAAPVEPGCGLDTGTIPPTPTYWGLVGAQHWRQWDRHCTCPVIAPFITCPHVNPHFYLTV